MLILYLAYNKKRASYDEESVSLYKNVSQQADKSY